jgi:hypothetical protein
MLELLRPPAHRGPLIAAGAVLLTIGLLLEEARLADEVGVGWHFLFCASAAALFGAIALQWPTEGGRPLASQSVLLVCALALLAVALLNLSEVLGAEGGISSGTLTWVLLVVGAAASWPATRKRSAICALIAAIAFGAALLAAWDWIFDPAGVTPFRWLLLALALVYALLSLVLRGASPRHSDQMVNAAGLAIFAIAATGVWLTFFGFAAFALEPDSLLPGFWELVVLAAGIGLVAYGAVDRAPGAAYLGVANLAAFFLAVTAVSDPTLEWWPVGLIVLGAVALVAGLRPRRPLPPEPTAYGARDLPLAARSEGETVVSVRHQ